MADRKYQILRALAQAGDSALHLFLDRHDLPTVLTRLSMLETQVQSGFETVGERDAEKERELEQTVLRVREHEVDLSEIGAEIEAINTRLNAIEELAYPPADNTKSGD